MQSDNYLFIVTARTWGLCLYYMSGDEKEGFNFSLYFRSLYSSESLHTSAMKKTSFNKHIKWGAASYRYTFFVVRCPSRSEVESWGSLLHSMHCGYQAAYFLTFRDLALYKKETKSNITMCKEMVSLNPRSHAGLEGRVDQKWLY